MGTKNDPGQYDCYKKAEPDEPMFVLLARDPLAPILVETWAGLRWLMNKADGRQVEESTKCAQAMRDWFRRNRKNR